METSEFIRCPWCMGSELMQQYHDQEWGVPVHNDTKLFEFMVLDAFQAGLSWKTILHKRENFRKAFDNFDINKIAHYQEDKIKSLLVDAGIIRNKQKIATTITNAQAFIKVQSEFGSFDKYIWQFTQHKVLVNNWSEPKQVPARTAESDAMSKDLQKRGFKFAGSTICYAFMQAAGMVNDHLASCTRYRQLL